MSLRYFYVAAAPPPSDSEPRSKTCPRLSFVAGEAEISLFDVSFKGARRLDL